MTYYFYLKEHRNYCYSDEHTWPTVLNMNSVYHHCLENRIHHYEFDNFPTLNNFSDDMDGDINKSKF